MLGLILQLDLDRRGWLPRLPRALRLGVQMAAPGAKVASTLGRITPDAVAATPTAIAPLAGEATFGR